MLVIKPVRDRDEPLVPPVVARLVTSDEQERTALGIESIKHPIGPSGVLDDQFLPVILSCFHGDTTADAKLQVRLATVHAPSPGPRRLVKAPVAAHPLPSGEGGNHQSQPSPLGRGWPTTEAG
jgi:hypothetical protein